MVLPDEFGLLQLPMRTVALRVWVALSCSADERVSGAVRMLRGVRGVGSSTRASCECAYCRRLYARAVLGGDALHLWSYDCYPVLLLAIVVLECGDNGVSDRSLCQRVSNRGSDYGAYCVTSECLVP